MEDVDLKMEKPTVKQLTKNREKKATSRVKKKTEGLKDLLWLINLLQAFNVGQSEHMAKLEAPTTI